ncbi:MAG: hypothetical protein OHK0038_17060 [Flammeovirgaceae bacterium]
MKIEQIFWNKELGWKILKNANFNQSPQLVIIFGGIQVLTNFQENSLWLKKRFPKSIWIGCSTAGEIIDGKVFDNSLSVTAIEFEKTTLEFSFVEINNAEDSFDVGAKLIKQLPKENLKSVFVISEGVNINGTELVKGMRSALTDKVLLTGGLAADAGKFQKTYLFDKNKELRSGCVTAIIQSKVTLEVSITDTGIGIEKEFHASIFENFPQANSATTRKYGGTGLGLPITKKLLEMMGSTIQVESELEKGSKFFFEISLEKSENNTVSQVTDFTLDNINLQGYKLLLVEDNQINILVLKQFLKKTGVTFDIAENGKIAIEKMKSDVHFDMILMDLEMPEMDGFQAAEEIRKFNLKVPIIALTASALSEVIEKAFAIGINDVITKPYEPATLYKKMKIHLPTKNNVMY